MNKPTPRTNAAVTLTIGADFNSVCPNFARTLEIELAELTAERDQLRAQLHALRLVCGTTDADKFTTWVDRANARAEKAEAEAERYRLVTLKQDAELATAKERLRSEAMDDYAAIKDLQRDLATERARLDWLISGGVCMIQHTGGFHVSRLHAPVSRAAIDAAMQEEAK